MRIVTEYDVVCAYESGISIDDIMNFVPMGVDRNIVERIVYTLSSIKTDELTKNIYKELPEELFTL